MSRDCGGHPANRSSPLGKKANGTPLASSVPLEEGKYCGNCLEHDHERTHSTTGTLSPASVLRIGEDATTKLRCHVYAVYPLESYHKLGGRQVR